MSPSDQINAVALWAGLISSIAGIVLSVAALAFGILANNRATEVNDQTIKSLQKIESAVGQLSEDTRGLIKAGWEKMLGNVGATSANAGDSSDTRAIDEGLTEEALSKLLKVSELRDGLATTDQLEQIKGIVENLRTTLTAQAKGQSVSRSPTSNIDSLVTLIDSLSPHAHALLHILANGRHLTNEQYEKLSDSFLHEELEELRRAGLLVPLSGKERNRKVPVYWLPSLYSRGYKIASQLASRAAPSEISDVVEELKKVGYAVPPTYMI